MASPPLLTPTFVDLGGWTLVAGFTNGHTNIDYFYFQNDF